MLSENASLHYITTLTTVNSCGAILKHLGSRALKKNREQVLNLIDGGNDIFLEVETTIEFISGGGAYLPGLDDNFLADRVVTLPIVSS